MPDLTLAPPTPSPKSPRFATPPPVGDATRHVTTEIDALWQLTEELAVLSKTPVAALELVARTAGELTDAEAAAVLLHPASDLVLASRWGAIGMPLGYKSADVRRTLDAGWSAHASMPIRSGAHEIGCLWVGRHAAPFDAHETRVLRTLAAVTSLALPALMPGRIRTPSAPSALADPSAAPASRAPAASDSAPDPAYPSQRTHAGAVGDGLLPEALRLSVFPPALLRLFDALDAANVATIAAAVQADPVLAALMIRAGNGAADGRARTTRNVRESIVFLGLHRVRALALGKLLNTMLIARTPLDTLLWEQAIGTGVRAREIELASTHDATADLALLAGLLHPVGAIALATAHHERYERVLLTSVRDDRPVTDVERDEFGVASATLTHQLLHAWHVEPLMRRTHDADEALQRALDWASAVTLAANPAWQALVARVGAPVRWLDARIAAATDRLGIDPVVLASVTTRSADATAEVRALFAAD